MLVDSFEGGGVVEDPEADSGGCPDMEEIGGCE